MPNTKSAGRRMRNSARKKLQNQTVKSSLHNLERKYAGLLTSGKKEEATAALRNLSSALDKASKKGVIHWARANRHKSRLSLRLNAASKAKAA